MPILPKPNYKVDKLKISKSLKYNLKLLASHKETRHLISYEKLEKGFLLAEENKPVQGIYFILKGKVKIFHTEANQKTKIIRLASKGELVGFSSLNMSHYWLSAVALEDVEAYFVSIKNLKQILKNNSKLSLLFVNALALKLHHQEIRQRYLDLFPAQERVIETLLLIASKFGEVTENGLEIYDCTLRREIASFANISIENTIRIFRNLIAENLITVQRKKIIIINKEELVNKLKNYCCSHKLSDAFNDCYIDLM